MAQEKDMTFWDHLEALRWTVLRSLAAIVVVAIVLFFFKEFIFNIILAPTFSDFFVYRWLGTDTSLQLINTEVSAQFMVHMKVCLVGGFVLSFPYVIYEIWKFVAPALYEHERTAVRWAFLLASFLFYLGLAVGYVLVLPLMVNFFEGYKVSAEVANMISLNSYMSTFSGTVLVFGLVFEFPTVMALLSRIGILSRETLAGGWRVAVVAIVVTAALITPSGDPVSLAIVSLPLFVLYGFSILLCRKAAP